MTATLTAPGIEEQEQHLVLPGFLSWNQYVAISDALPDWAGLRMIYVDGRLTLLTTSRRHDRASKRVGQLVVAIADGCGIAWEDSGRATFRREERRGGVEGDDTFYFGENAERMSGSQEIDLSIPPPPDLAIEVELTHPADDAMIVYGRLGVPEVWRINLKREMVGFWSLGDDGTYAPIDRSTAFPFLGPGDVLAQLLLAEPLVASRWHAQLDGWVRDVLLPRLGGGA